MEATLREHIHVYKIEVSSYSKSILLILSIDILLVCAAALCFHQIEDCGDRTGSSSLGDQYLRLVDAGYKVCSTALNCNETKCGDIFKESLIEDCHAAMNDRLVLTEHLKSEDPDEASNNCTLTWNTFVKWFYFSSSVNRGLGYSSSMELSTSGKVFYSIYSILVLFVTVATYIIFSMFIITVIKLTITGVETRFLKKTDTISRLDLKVKIILILFSIVLWLVLSALMCVYSESSYSQATFESLSEILTIGHNADVFGQRWTSIADHFVAFAFYLLIYDLEMGAVFCLVKSVSGALISKRSGLFCITHLQNEHRKYSVTCPKCVMVEQELEHIKRMRALKDSVA